MVAPAAVLPSLQTAFINGGRNTQLMENAEY
jgi:hypothetical protein